MYIDWSVFWYGSHWAKEKFQYYLKSSGKGNNHQIMARPFIKPSLKSCLAPTPPTPMSALCSLWQNHRRFSPLYCLHYTPTQYTFGIQQFKRTSSSTLFAPWGQWRVLRVVLGLAYCTQRTLTELAYTKEEPALSLPLVSVEVNKASVSVCWYFGRDGRRRNLWTYSVCAV